MGTVTRWEVLEEMLEKVSAQKRCFSEGFRNQVPKEGYERAFYAEEEKAEIIRQMMRETMEGGGEHGNSRNEKRKDVPVLRSGAGDDSGNTISDMGRIDHEAGDGVQGSMFEHTVSGSLYGAALFPDAGGSEEELEQEGLTDDSELYAVQGYRDGTLRTWQRDIMDRDRDLSRRSGSGSAEYTAK